LAKENPMPVAPPVMTTTLLLKSFKTFFSKCVR
jgi:hypothetical protein